MAFSLNQNGGGEVPGGVTQPAGIQSTVAASGPAAVPDSPFLFMRQRGGEVSVNAYLQILLVVIAALSVFVSIVLFLYSAYLSSSIKSKQEEIALRDTSFKDYPYEDMKRLSTRMMNLESLLKGYVSVRSPLKLLEDVVEKQVYFDEFLLSKRDAGYVASFTIITSNYRALIQQLEALNLTQYSKVAPQPKTSALSDGVSKIKIKVTTPIIVQGVLPDQVTFLPGSGTASSTQVSLTATSTQ